MLKNCVIKAAGVSNAAYHNQLVSARGTPGFILSPSSMKLFRKNPWKWVKGFNPDGTSSTDFGSLVDTLLLTPDQFKLRYVMVPDTYDSEGMECPICKSITDSKKCGSCKVERVMVTVKKDWNFNSDSCQKWLVEQSKSGLEPITGPQFDAAVLAAKTMMEDDTCNEFIRYSQTQVHVVGEWHDKATGLIIPVQCLIDCVPDKRSPFQKALGDVKSTRNAEQEPFLWDAYRMGYHVQAAFDLDLYQMATRTNQGDEQSGEDRVEWNFLILENMPPYAIGRRTLPQDFIQLGRLTYQDTLAQYARCLKTGQWTGYDMPDQFTVMQLHPKMEYEALSQNLEHQQAEALGEIGGKDGDDVYAGA